MLYFGRSRPFGKLISSNKSFKEGGKISEKDLRVNAEITATEVRVIDTDGTQLGVMPFLKALDLATERGLDLVEVAPNAKPPVCRLMDYGKYLYEKTKKEKEARKSQKQVEVKEVRLRPKIGEHDLQVVLRKVRSFLEDGAKVKIRLRFRGREITHPEVAKDLLVRIANEVKDISTVEQKPKLDGYSLLMVIAPAKKKKPSPASGAKSSKKGGSEK
jgi:translation initiation factor IF-3